MDDLSRGQAAAATDQGSLEEKLAQAEERLSFYASFDKLIQDNIARSGELMRDALALREQATAETRRAQDEIDRVRTETEQAVTAARQAAADASGRAEDERRRFGETLLALHDELTAVQETTAAIARRVGSLLGELGAAEFVPVAWASAPQGAAVETDQPFAGGVGLLDASKVAEFEDELPPSAAAETAAQDEIAVAAEVVAETEPDVTGAADPGTDAGAWAPPEPSASEPAADGGALAAGDLTTYPSDRPGTGELSQQGEEPARGASAAADAWEDVLPAYPTATGEVEEATGEVAATSLAGAASSAPATTEGADEPRPDIDAMEDAIGGWLVTEPSADTGAEVVTEPEAEPEPEPDGAALTAEAEPETAVATDAEPESRSIMVLVHGVPRAAAALSLQRHLAGLDHVEGVEAREYAEGILRLQVTARRPLALDDMRAWDGGGDLEPIHLQEDVVEVRLPGALGF